MRGKSKISSGINDWAKEMGKKRIAKTTCFLSYLLWQGEEKEGKDTRLKIDRMGRECRIAALTLSSLSMRVPSKRKEGKGRTTR